MSKDIESVKKGSSDKVIWVTFSDGEKVCVTATELENA